MDLLLRLQIDQHKHIHNLNRDITFCQSYFFIYFFYRFLLYYLLYYIIILLSLAMAATVRSKRSNESKMEDENNNK